MPKPKSLADIYSLTPEQVRRIVEALPDMDLNGSDNDIGTFLLLLRAFTYASSDERQDMLVAAEEVLLPYLGAIGRALDALIEGRRKALQKP